MQIKGLFIPIEILQDSSLTMMQKAIIVLQNYAENQGEKLSNAEIARMLGVHTSTVWYSIEKFNEKFNENFNENFNEKFNAHNIYKNNINKINIKNNVCVKNKKEKAEKSAENTHTESPIFSIEDIKKYFTSAGATEDEAERFYNYNSARNWKIGNMQIKDFALLADNWIKNINQKQNTQTYTKKPFRTQEEIEAIKARYPHLNWESN